MATLDPNLIKRSFSLGRPFLAAGSFAAPWPLRVLVALNALISNEKSHLFLAFLHLALELQFFHHDVFLHLHHLGLDRYLSVLRLLFAARGHFEHLTLPGYC
jgi:hypothetical protein